MLRGADPQECPGAYPPSTARERGGRLSRPQTEQRFVRSGSSHSSDHDPVEHRAFQEPSRPELDSILGRLEQLAFSVSSVAESPTNGFGVVVRGTMSGKKRVKYTRPTTRTEDSGAVCGAWAPRPGSVTDTPSALVLLGRDDASVKGVAVREYNFDADSLSETVRIWSRFHVDSR
jgi:hypothetical protein